MDYRKHLLDLIDAYAEARGLSPSRVTTLVMNSGSVYRSLKEGKDITVGRVESAVHWFDAHWPDDLPWPEGLARPSISPAHSSDEAA